MLAAEPLRGLRGLAPNDRLEDAMVILVAAANVSFFKRHDIAWRRDRHLLTRIDHVVKEPRTGRRMDRDVERCIDPAILRSMLVGDLPIAKQIVAVPERLL